jgi:hypothetical protein
MVPAPAEDSGDLLTLINNCSFSYHSFSAAKSVEYTYDSRA